MLGVEKHGFMLIVPRAQQGFSLLELMATVTVMLLLVMMAAPSLISYTENSKLRAVAENLSASAQVARTEAIRTNRDVQLALTTEAPTVTNVDTTNLSATASGWIVRAVVTASPLAYAFIDGKNAIEGSGRTDGTSTVSVSAADAGGTAASSITFTGAGSTTLGARWDVDVKSTTATCAPTGSARCLRVVVTTSGQIKTCDPAATAANDSRAC
jgi:type IV fimbrial biogenesis protein FimT